MKRGSQRQRDVWLWVPVVLSAAGIVVSGYLVSKRFTGGSLACSRWAQCDAVNNSVYAVMYGVPVSVIGLAGYALLFALALMAVWSEARRHRPLLMLSFFLSLGGVAFSIYLTYIEVFLIQALCSWCVASAIIITLLALVSGLNVWRASPSSNPSASALAASG